MAKIRLVARSLYEPRSMRQPFLETALTRTATLTVNDHESGSSPGVKLTRQEDEPRCLSNFGHETALRIKQISCPQRGGMWP